MNEKLHILFCQRCGVFLDLTDQLYLLKFKIKICQQYYQTGKAGYCVDVIMQIVFLCPGNDIKRIHCVLGMTLNSPLLSRAWQLDCCHVCAFEHVYEAVSDGKTPVGEGADSLFSWRGLHFYFVLHFVMCEMVTVSPNQILLFRGKSLKFFCKMQGREDYGIESWLNNLIIRPDITYFNINQTYK